MFLDDLSPEETAQVKALGVPRKLDKDRLVIEEGMLGTSFFFIVSGSVVVRKRVRGDRYKELVRLGPGDLIGEVGFLGVELRTASVVTLSYCDLLEFEHDAFAELLAASPVIGFKLYRGMARELAEKLAASDEDLMDTVVWALDRTRHGTAEDGLAVPKRAKKLTFAPSKPLPRKDSPPDADKNIIM